MAEPQVNPVKSQPHFDEPPLDEVAMGVQFDPLVRLTAARIGEFWSQVRSRYPNTEDQPPLRHTSELPEAKAVKGEIAVRVAAPQRVWMVSPDGSELLQVQRDQFFRNWRRFTGSETYPRFPALIEAFHTERRNLWKFLAEADLGDLKINQCELTYFNHVPQGTGWSTYADLSQVFTFLRWPAGVTANPEIAEWSAKYKLPEGRGRLGVEMSPAFRGRDFTHVAVLSLKVRGAPRDGSEEGLDEWFDLAHEWVVRAFDELTTPSMHAIWKKRS